MAHNWLDVPDDLLIMIVDKLFLLEDYIRFGATCVKMHSIFIENPHPLLRLPVLMIPNSKHDQDQEESQTRSFYSLSEKRVYDFKLRVPHNLNCRGSSFGWLFTVDDHSSAVRLINPFLSINNDIHLPSLSTIDSESIFFNDYLSHPYYVHKAILSANPLLTSEYIVMVIYGRFSRLAFLKPGDKTWTSINQWKSTCFQDVIYHQGQFYAVHVEGYVVACDVSSPDQPLLIQVTPSLPEEYWKEILNKYLVESLGELLVVIREVKFFLHEFGVVEEYGPFRIPWTYKTVGFEIFKFDPIGLNWVEVKSLCGHMLFLGDNSSMSLLTLNFLGCKPNHIYFTDDNMDFYYEDLRPCGPSDNGVFNLEDGSFEPHYPMEFQTWSPMIVPPSLWVLPTLRGCCK